MTTINPATTTPVRTKLDCAIAASIAAMAAMSLFVMAQQLHVGPAFAAASDTAQNA